MDLVAWNRFDFIWYVFIWSLVSVYDSNTKFASSVIRRENVKHLPKKMCLWRAVCKQITRVNFRLIIKFTCQLLSISVVYSLHCNWRRNSAPNSDVAEVTVALHIPRRKWWSIQGDPAKVRPTLLVTFECAGEIQWFLAIWRTILNIKFLRFPRSVSKLLSHCQKQWILPMHSNVTKIMLPAKCKLASL